MGAASDRQRCSSWLQIQPEERAASEVGPRICHNRLDGKVQRISTRLAEISKRLVKAEIEMVACCGAAAPASTFPPLTHPEPSDIGANISNICDNDPKQ